MGIHCPEQAIPECLAVKRYFFHRVEGALSHRREEMNTARKTN